MAELGRTKWSVRGEVRSQREVVVRTVILTLGVILVADGVDLIANLIWAPWQIVRSAIQTTLISGVLGAFVIYTHSRANLKLYEMKTHLARISETDFLTDLLNRRAFMELLAAVNLAQTAHVLMLVDIDEFKAVNDDFGHPAGDAVIAGVGALMHQVFPPPIPLARLGGEEFAALLPEVSCDAGLPWAERFRQRVAEHAFAAGEHMINVRVSVGLATFTAGEPVSEVYSRADKAMYTAKHAGGDRVVIAAAA